MSDEDFSGGRKSQKQSDPSGDEDRPFTPFERKQIRELLQADKRRQWVLSAIKTSALWISAVGAALILLKDYMRGFLSGSGIR